MGQYCGKKDEFPQGLPRRVDRILPSEVDDNNIFSLSNGTSRLRASYSLSNTDRIGRQFLAQASIRSILEKGGM